MPSNRPWTSKEVAILREKLPEIGLTGLVAAGLLDRSQRAIEAKAQALGLKNHCKDCGAKIHPGSISCGSCATKAAWAGGVYGKEWRRKKSEATTARWARGDFEGLAEAVKAAWARGDFEGLAEARKAAWARGDFAGVAEAVKAAHARGDFDGNSEAMKAAWKRGDFDGVFQSPTKPEQAIMAVLDFMGIDFTFNTLRLESYTYDFHLPDLQVLVEYDGWYWHGNPKAIERDKIKDDLAEENGLRLIRLKGGRGKDLTGPEIWGRLSQEL